MIKSGEAGKSSFVSLARPPGPPGPVGWWHLVAVAGGSWEAKNPEKKKKSPYIEVLGHPFIAYANVHV